LSITGDAAPKAKVLSISGDTTSKLETAGKTKVLTIGATAPASAAKENVDKEVPDAGVKVVAAKAIEKTGGPVAAQASSGKTSPTPSSGRNSPSRTEARAAREADAVAKEQAAEVDEEVLAEIYGKEHVNVIFLGRKLAVGSSSTILTSNIRSCRCGQINSWRLYIVRDWHGRRADNGKIQARSEGAGPRDMVSIMGFGFDKRRAL
jgi:hypothetical protein